MDGNTESRRQSATVSLLICLTMLTLPAVYVLSHSSEAQAAPAQSALQSSGPQLAELELLAHTQPTTANRLNLSQAYIDNAQYGRAVTLLTSIVAEDPHQALAWNNLCVAHTLQLEFDLAIPACEAGMRADASIQLLRNNLNWAQGERTKVLVALSEQARTPVAQRDSAFYLAEGLNHQHLGEYDAALTCWRQSLELDPANGAALNNIGIVQMFQHRYTDAELSFRRATQLNPASQLMRNNLAWAMSEVAAHQ